MTAGPIAQAVPASRIDCSLNTATISMRLRLGFPENASAAVATWLLIGDQVEQLAEPNFPRRPSTRVTGAHELVAHKNYVVYFDQDESNCTITSLAAVHVARRVP